MLDHPEISYWDEVKERGRINNLLRLDPDSGRMGMVIVLLCVGLALVFWPQVFWTNSSWITLSAWTGPRGFGGLFLLGVALQILSYILNVALLKALVDLLTAGVWGFFAAATFMGSGVSIELMLYIAFVVKSVLYAVQTATRGI